MGEAKAESRGKKSVGSKAYITKTFSLKNTSQINNTFFLHKRLI